MLGDAGPAQLSLDNEWSPSAIKAGTGSKENNHGPQEPGWTSMMRRGSHSSRNERPGLYYAIYVDPTLRKIVKIGNALPLEKNRDVEIEHLTQVLPIRTNKSAGCWQVGPQELQNRILQGRVRLGRETEYGFVVNYLPDGEYKKILDGDYNILGNRADGSIVAYKADTSLEDKFVAPTQWKIASHDASAYGSTMLASILTSKRFSFPKSLYAVHDTIRFFAANKPNALIVDFFAGSGTTLHAVNLLNEEDGGHRRCIMVTNNEVSADEAKALIEQGYHPGDEEWEKLGIARYVTWPRTVCSIEGHDINGDPLKGNYLGSDLPMAGGFKANAAYFKLGFLDKNAVALGKQFKEMLPTLWMKAGAIGKCPVPDGDTIPEVLLFPENHFTVLTEETAFSELEAALAEHPEIETVYIITDYEAGYCAMAKNLNVKHTYQLYRDYLDNFRINIARD